jgi:hypothetical protein
LERARCLPEPVVARRRQVGRNVGLATPGVGMLSIPAIGQFKNGRGDFYDQQPINDRSVLVRFSIWGISPSTAQSEQAFSVDGGKTWEANWVNEYQRAPSSGP